MNNNDDNHENGQMTAVCFDRSGSAATLHLRTVKWVQ